jgi:anti-sigma factor RsiW
MRCDEVMDKLDAYLAGELPPARHMEVDLHVGACNDCRRVLERAQRLGSLLAETSVPPVPYHFAERVLSLTMNGHKQKVPAPSVKAWWLTFSMPMRAAVAASLLVGAMSGAILGWSASRITLSRATAQTRQADSVFAGYGLDILGDAPDGSLAESFLALLDGRNGECR